MVVIDKIKNIRHVPDMKKFRERVFCGGLTSKDGLRRSTHLMLMMNFFRRNRCSYLLVSTVGMHSSGEDHNSFQRQRVNKTKKKLGQDWSNIFRKIPELL